MAAVLDRSAGKGGKELLKEVQGYDEIGWVCCLQRSVCLVLTVRALEDSWCVGGRGYF